MSLKLIIGIAASFLTIALAAWFNMRRPASVVASVKRAKLSWEYFYVTLGFSLSIEAGIISLIEPLRWPFNLTAYCLTTGCTIYLWLNGWFQNKLLSWKMRYEQRETHPEDKPILGLWIFVVVFCWLVAWAYTADSHKVRLTTIVPVVAK